MAKYVATGKSWLTLSASSGPRLIKEGEKFEYDGWPNAMMEPIDDEGEANVATLKLAKPRYGEKLPETPEKARTAMKIDKAGPISAGDDKPSGPIGDKPGPGRSKGDDDDKPGPGRK